MPFTVLSVPHHCGRRGIGVGNRRPMVLQVGRSALLKLMQSCCCHDLLLETECKTDVDDHAHISANGCAVEPVFFGLNTKQYLQLSLDALLAL